MDRPSDVARAKPHLTYQHFIASLQKPSAPTLAELIERYISEMESVRQVGASQQFVMRAISRRWIGARPAIALTHNDAIAYARGRRQERVINGTRLVGPVTVMQELSHISVVLKYAGAAWPDCEGVTAAPILTAKPFLLKQGLIGTSIPRDRRPSAEEIATLERLAAARNKNWRTKIDFVKLCRWQIESSRRVSETTRLEWRFWREAEQTMLVTKIKDPRTRDKNKVAALTDGAQLTLYELAWEINAAGPDAWNDPTPFIFHWRGQPWNPKSASQGYADLKRKAGIAGLRLHDSRAECSSRLIEEGRLPTEAILVTLHENTQTFERRYMRLRPENFKKLERRAVSAAG